MKQSLSYVEVTVNVNGSPATEYTYEGRTYIQIIPDARLEVHVASTPYLQDYNLGIALYLNNTAVTGSIIPRDLQFQKIVKITRRTVVGSARSPLVWPAVATTGGETDSEQGILTIVLDHVGALQEERPHFAGSVPEQGGTWVTGDIVESNVAVYNFLCRTRAQLEALGVLGKAAVAQSPETESNSSNIMMEALVREFDNNGDSWFKVDDKGSTS